MARYLFTTLPTNDLGLLARSLPIAAELAARGSEVVFCSPARAPSLLIADAGFDNRLPHHPLYHLMAAEPSLRGLGGVLKTARREFGLLRFVRELVPALPTKAAPATAEMWDMGHMGALSGMLDAGFVRANCEALVGLIEDCRPDAVVDFWNPYACIAARATQTPLATVIQADMHPQSRGFVWWKPPPPDRPAPVPAVNEVLAGYGLPPVAKVEELCVGDLTLVAGMPETDPLPETAAVTYVGPLLWQRPEARLPAWAEALSDEQPVIWVYPGNPRYLPVRSPVDSDVVARAAVEALAGREQVVLTTGHHPLPRDLRPLPPNFRHAPYVPGQRMAERSDLLIHHGGYGSCQTGLLAGTPAVIVPTFSERESNARRVAVAGAGEVVVPIDRGMGRKKRLDAADLRAAVDRVLGDPAYAANARRVGEALRAYGGAREAARLIQEFVTSPKAFTGEGH